MTLIENSKKILEAIERFKIETIRPHNSANSKWELGVDYWYSLPKPIPCVTNDGKNYRRGFCELINVFHPQSEYDEEFYVFYRIKDNFNRQICDIDEYKEARIEDEIGADYTKLITLANLNKKELLELERYLLKKTKVFHINLICNE